MKKWHEHSDPEKKKILEDLKSIYAKHGHPEWLELPNYQSQVINDYKLGGQRTQTFFRISGTSTEGAATKAIEEDF